MSYDAAFKTLRCVRTHCIDLLWSPTSGTAGYGLLHHHGRMRAEQHGLTGRGGERRAQRLRLLGGGRRPHLARDHVSAAAVPAGRENQPFSLIQPLSSRGVRIT